MKKEYWWIIIVYIVMQLSSFVGLPLLMLIFKDTGIQQSLAVPIWLITSFSIALVIILFMLRKEFTPKRGLDDRQSSVGASILWAFFGVFMALAAQSIAAMIESMFGIDMGSENTQDILQIIDILPLAVIVTSIFGPILEEIVFRKIIFGSLYKRFNFFISALISSVVFALAHMEFAHILLYSAMGFTFAFLYVMTKRIIVPIFAHVAMNTFVVLVQLVFKDDIERLSRPVEAIHNFIGGFL